MTDVIIRAEGLGKKYLIGHQAQNERYVALREVIARTANGFVRSVRDMLQGKQLVAGDEVEEFWALKDVNFEIRRGDVVGVIGRNGAGKSTLLKILSRITEPSTGRVEIRGRVASLLEVGTGFHPELSGRENIYLNGAILGMARVEIKRKFDEIVDFAEVEKFLDTPVKRYSSGMYVRLAFAVAAHLEPEVLVVDEVLAVGDAEFQKKCLGKMGEVARHGRTVLFVSHNMNAVSTLCGAAILLRSGRVACQGEVRDVISHYLNESRVESQFIRGLEARLSSIYVASGKLEISKASEHSIRKLTIDLSIHSDSSRKISIEFRVKDNIGSGICFASIGTFDSKKVVPLQPGVNKVIISLDISNLAKGNYCVGVDLAEPHVQYFDRIEDFLSFTLDPLIDGGSTRFLDQARGFGSIQLPAELIDMSLVAT